MDLNKLTKKQLIDLLNSQEKREVNPTDNLEKDYVRYIFENTTDPLLVFNIDKKGNPGNFISANQAACSLLEYNTDEITNKNLNDILPQGYHQIAEKLLTNLILRKSVSSGLVVVSKDQLNIPVKINATLFLDTNNYTILAILNDLTENRRSSYLIQKDYENSKRLLKLFLLAPDLDDQELFNYVLDTAVDITGSSIGFFHKVADDQNTIILTAWNKEALKNCDTSHNTHYPINIAGNWVDCIRTKKPVIYNDFAKSPNQKGLPKGHTPLKRFMSIPVVEENKIKYIFGVGNKHTDYTNNDIIQIQLITSELVKVLKKRKSEKALQKSEEQLREAQSVARIGSWELDIVNNDLSWSKEVYSILDLDHKKYRGSYNLFLSRVHPEDRELVSSSYAHSLKTKTPYNITHRLITSNGKLRYINERCKTFYNSKGKPVRSLGTVQDVTEQIIANKKLEKSEQEFRNIFENSVVGFYRINPNGEILMANNTLAEMLGYKSAEELLKININESHFNQEHPRQKFNEIINKTGKIVDLESAWINKDKSIIYVSESTRTIYNENNKILYYEGTVVDITQRKRTQKALLKSEQRFKALFEAANDAIFIMKDDKFIDCNKKTLEIFRCKKSQIINKSPVQFSPQKQADNSNSTESALKKINAALKGKPQVFEWIHKKLDGELFDAEVSLNKIDIDNEVFIQAIVRNITERKKAEEQIRNLNENLEQKVKERTHELEQSEQKFRDIAELLPQAIFETDLQGKITYTNKYGYKLTGYNTKDLKKGISIYQAVDPTEREMLQHNIQQKLKGRSSRPDEYNLITKKGTKKPILIYSSPIIRNEKIEGLRGILVDISTRKKYEEELKKLSQAIEQSPASVVITNLDGEIIYANSSFTKISGYRKSEAIGQNPRILKTEHFPKSYYKELWNTILNGKKWTGEFKNKKKNGEIYWEYASISPIVNDQNEIISFVAVKEDITERKKIEQELILAKEAAESATKAKTRFLANMSHEIRTPMNAVLGFTELLLTLVKDEQQKGYLRALHSSGNTLLSIINDILDLSKVEAGKLELNYDFIESKSFFNDLYHIFSLKAQNKGLEFVIKINKNVPQNIFVDDLRLRQSLINIINNSIKFTNKGFIKVTVKTSQVILKKGKNLANLTITVEDSGIGISKENQSRIFKSFAQESGQTTRKFGGTGLGLAITNNLIKLMKGTISVNSIPNKGSTFTIHLPNVQVSNKTLEVENNFHYSIQNIEFSPSTVLVVDDIENNRRFLAEALRQLDLKVHAAENGEIALLFIEKVKPDLIITDIRMPIMNGFDLLEEIRKNINYKDIPVVATSASVLFDDGMKQKLAKFNGFLPKPVLTVKLIPLLTEYLPHKKYDSNEKELHLTKKAIKLLPKTIESLETKFHKKWVKFEKRKPVHEIQLFSEELIEFANYSDNKILLDYAESLKKSATTYDIDIMLKLLKSYEHLIKKLKNYESTN